MLRHDRRHILHLQFKLSPCLTWLSYTFILGVTTLSLTTLSIVGLFATLSKTVLSAVMMSVRHSECCIVCFDECHYAECHYAQCHYA